MNHKAIKRHFGLKDARVYLEAYEGGYLISDGYAIYRIEKDSPALADRTQYPNLPDEGQTLHRIGRDSAWIEDDRAVSHLFAIPSNAHPLMLTNLIHESGSGADDSRLLVWGGHHHPVLLSTRLMHLLGGTIEQLKEYEYRQSVSTGPVCAVKDDVLMAVIMPQSMQMQWFDMCLEVMGYELKQREEQAA